MISGSGRRRGAPRAPEDDGQHAQSSIRWTGTKRIGAGDDAAELRELPLAAGSAARAAFARASSARLRVELEARARREPGGAQEPERVILEGGLGGRTEDAASASGMPSGGVDRVPTGRGTGDRLTVKSRARRSSSIESARSAVTSTCQLSVGATAARWRTPPRGRRPTPRDARDRPGGLLLGAALHGQVGVGDLRSSSASRIAPPTIQTWLARSSSAVRAAAIEGRGGESVLERRAHSITSRGTRCEIPQVTS